MRYNQPIIKTESQLGLNLYCQPVDMFWLVASFLAGYISQAAREPETYSAIQKYVTANKATCSIAATSGRRQCRPGISQYRDSSGSWASPSSGTGTASTADSATDSTIYGCAASQRTTPPPFGSDALLDRAAHG